MNLEALVTHIKKLGEGSGDSKISVLYHYTTADVLDKLLEEDGDLRCTYFGDLNDSAEFWAGYDYFVYYYERNGESRIVQKLQDLRGRWDKLHKLYGNTLWLMSFSAEKDSLYQWVAYTDRQKGGVAIGFDKAKLENAAKASTERTNRDVMLLPCFYVRRRKRKDSRNESEFVDKRLDGLIEFIMENYGSKSNSWEELETAILVFSSIVKDKVFSEEHEWRLIVLTKDTMSCKGAKVIAQKARLPLGIGEKGKRKVGELISEIQTSPHGNQKRLMHSIMLPKFSDSGLQYKVAFSDLPYKGEKQ